MKITNGTILVVFIGIRPQEIFNSKITPKIHSILKKNYNSIIFNHLTVANKYKISYPGYNDILTGQVNPIIKNNCNLKNPNKTFFEKYKLKLFHKREI